MLIYVKIDSCINKTNVVNKNKRALYACKFKKIFVL